MHFAIEIECPQCGGSILFSEDSSVIKCGYCLSALLVAGHEGVLSYYLPVGVTPSQALIEVKKEVVGRGVKRATLSSPTLLYFPFWRLRGLILNWAFYEEKVDDTKYLWSVSDEGETSVKPCRASKRTYVKDFSTSSLDLSFPAGTSPHPGVKRLAYESRSLRLKLLAPLKVEGNNLLRPTIGMRTALNESEKAVRKKFELKRGSLELSETRIVGRILSLVFSPFYLVTAAEGDEPVTLLVDAVNGRITSTIGEPASRGIADRVLSPGKEFKSRTLGFIPFRCRECGWDLLLIPESTVHICPHCNRAWETHKGSLREVPYDTVVPPPSGRTSPTYLPFWKLRMSIKVGTKVVNDVGGFRSLISFSSYLRDRNPQRELFFYMPAFRLNQIETLDKLASHITRRQPEIRLSGTPLLPKSRIGGVLVSQEEAYEMSRITYLTLVTDMIKTGMEPRISAELKLMDTRLTYFPFVDELIYWREPLTGAFFHKKSLSLENTGQVG